MVFPDLKLKCNFIKKHPYGKINALLLDSGIAQTIAEINGCMLLLL